MLLCTRCMLSIPLPIEFCGRQLIKVLKDHDLHPVLWKIRNRVRGYLQDTLVRKPVCGSYVALAICFRFPYRILISEPRKSWNLLLQSSWNNVYWPLFVIVIESHSLSRSQLQHSWGRNGLFYCYSIIICTWNWLPGLWMHEHIWTPVSGTRVTSMM